LRRNKHCNSKLQRAYNKYGKNAFEYHILAEYSSDTNLDHYEQLWTIVLNAVNDGYVLRVGNRNGRHTNESRKKMSISAKKRGTPWWKGRKHTDETKAKISASRIGRKFSKS
jgi:group I intron endonuclease